MPPDQLDLMRGTLDLMVLRALADQPRHGYGVARWIRDRSDDTLSVEDGALYTALHRMENRGWLSSSWGRAESQKRAKFYTLTRKGIRQLDKSETQWRRYAAAVDRVIAPSNPEAPA